MANRHYFTLLLLFCSILTTSLFAQTPDTSGQSWVIDNLPPGDHVPNQLIIRYDTPVTVLQIQAWIRTPIPDKPELCDEWQKLDRPIVRELVKGTHFLIDFTKGFPCGLGTCDAILPDGTIHNQLRATDLWPNYVISTGVSLADESCFPDDIRGEIDRVEEYSHPANPVSINEEPLVYDALKHCPPDYNMNVSYGNKRVGVVVLDSGLDPTFHPGIFQNQPEVSRDLYGHGTAVAGVILHQAHQQNKHVSIKIYPYPVLGEDGTGTLSDLVDILEVLRHKNNYSIIHMSLGYTPLPCDLTNHTAISESLSELDQAGIITVSSAGNRPIDLGVTPQYPAAESGLDLGITVGALSCDNPMRSYFSSYGSPAVDFMAPGIDILVPNSVDNLFRCAEGTSFSAPLVTSMIAGYLSQGYTANEVTCLLRTGAVPADGTISSYGWAAAINATVVCPELSEHPGSPLEEFRSKNATDESSNLKLFPNPARNVLRMSLPRDRELRRGTLQVLDVRGIPVLAPGFLTDGESVDVSSLAPGLYFVRYQAKGRTLVQRFLKQ